MDSLLRAVEVWESAGGVQDRAREERRPEKTEAQVAGKRRTEKATGKKRRGKGISGTSPGNGESLGEQDAVEEEEEEQEDAGGRSGRGRGRGRGQSGSRGARGRGRGRARARGRGRARGAGRGGGANAHDAEAAAAAAAVRSPAAGCVPLGNVDPIYGRRRVLPQSRRRKQVTPVKRRTPSSARSAGEDPDLVPRSREEEEAVGRLLCALSSNAMQWSVYEWFYSTIDRDYFARNEFLECLQRLRLHETCRSLPQTAWSTIRTAFGRPRRCSPAFLRGERAKLKHYRYIIRQSQLSQTQPPSEFPYDVPWPHEIGNAVTAYHTGEQILHRGVVLTVDPQTGVSRVQWDRPELQSSRCAPEQIAVHGEAHFMFVHDRALEPTDPTEVLGGFGGEEAIQMDLVGHGRPLRPPNAMAEPAAAAAAATAASAASTRPPCNDLAQSPPGSQHQAGAAMSSAATAEHVAALKHAAASMVAALSATDLQHATAAAGGASAAAAADGTVARDAVLAAPPDVWLHRDGGGILTGGRWNAKDAAVALQEERARLMVLVMKLLERKQQLLHLLRQLNADAQYGPIHLLTKSETMPRFQQQYAWLVVNIEVVNRALEPALHQLRRLVMAEDAAAVADVVDGSEAARSPANGTNVNSLPQPVRQRLEERVRALWKQERQHAAAIVAQQTRSHAAATSASAATADSESHGCSAGAGTDTGTEEGVGEGADEGAPNAGSVESLAGGHLARKRSRLDSAAANAMDGEQGGAKGEHADGLEASVEEVRDVVATCMALLLTLRRVGGASGGGMYEAELHLAVQQSLEALRQQVPGEASLLQEIDGLLSLCEAMLQR